MIARFETERAPLVCAILARGAGCPDDGEDLLAGILRKIRPGRDDDRQGGIGGDSLQLLRFLLRAGLDGCAVKAGNYCSI